MPSGATGVSAEHGVPVRICVSSCIHSEAYEDPVTATVEPGLVSGLVSSRDQPHCGRWECPWWNLEGTGKVEQRQRMVLLSCIDACFHPWQWGILAQLEV